MSTIVLSVVGGVIGNAIAPGIGGVIGAGLGAAIGSTIDSQLIYPHLFPAPSLPDAARLSGLDITEFREGSPANFIMGQRVRVPGTVIWLSELHERRRGRSIGKGGGSQKVNTFSYSVDVAIAFAANRIDRLLAITADGKHLYSSTGEVRRVTLQPGQYEVRRERTRVGNEQRLSMLLLQSVTEVRTIHSGDLVTVEGMPVAVNNGTFKVFSAFRTEFDKPRLIYFDNPAVEAVLPLGTVGAPVTATTPVTITWIPEEFGIKFLADVRTYLGDDPQEVDSLLDAETISTGIRYNGTAYVVLEGLELERFGNRVPNFLLDVRERNARLSIKEAIELVLKWAGVPATRWDTSRLPTDTLTDNRYRVFGYSTQGVQTVEQALLPLMTAFNILAREENGRIVFFERGSESPIEVEEDDLTARVAGQEGGDREQPGRKVELVDIDDTLLPTQVSLTYLNASTMERGNVLEKRFEHVSQPNRIEVNLAIWLTDAQARRAAGRILWAAWRGRQIASFTLPPRYLQIRENSILSVPADGQLYQVLVTKVTRGANHMLEVEGVVEDVSTFTEMPEDATDPEIVVGPLPSVVDLEVLDIPPLRDEDADTPGYYVAARNIDPLESWEGVALFQAPVDDDDLYVQVDFLERETVIGRVLNAFVTQQDLEESIGFVTSGGWVRFADLEYVTTQGATGSNPKLDFTFDGMSAADSWEVWVKFTDTPGGKILPRGNMVIRVIEDEAGAMTAEINQAKSKAQLEASGQVIREGDWVTATDPANPTRPRQYALGSLGTATITIESGAGADNESETAIQSVRLVLRGLVVRTINASPGYWDRTSVFEVELLSGTLESRTELEILMGRNHARVGTEILAFRDAVLNAAGNWEISMLLRGLRNTEGAIASHVTDERFVLLEAEGVSFHRLNFEQLNKSVFLKPASPGQILAEVKSQKAEIIGKNMASFSPAHLRNIRTGTDVNWTWIRRSRAVSHVLGENAAVLFQSERFPVNVGTVAVPNVEDRAKYRYVIFRDTGKAVRSGFVYEEKLDYTAAQQSTDGVVAGNKVFLRVNQVTRGLRNLGQGGSAFSAVVTI